jgi:hypothetical protein
VGKAFKTYKQLTQEKETLEQLIKAQKQLLKADVEQLKWRVRPLSEIRYHVTHLTFRNAISLFVAFNSDVIEKKIFQEIIAASSGWPGKVLVPYVLKKYSPGFLAEQKKKIIKWFKLWSKKEFQTIEQGDSPAGK